MGFGCIVAELVRGCKQVVVHGTLVVDSVVGVGLGELVLEQGYTRHGQLKEVRLKLIPKFK